MPCSTIFDTLDLWTDPHYLKTRRLVEMVEHAAAGPVQVLRNPVLRPNSQAPPGGLSPLLGGHTGEVLAVELGLSAKEMAKLRGAGAIG